MKLFSKKNCYKMFYSFDSLFTDNRKIGIVLTTAGGIILIMGVVLLFDPVLLAMGNILFLGSVRMLLLSCRGMPFLFGFLRCLHFFNPLENPGVREDSAANVLRNGRGLCVFLEVCFLYYFVGLYLE